MSIYTKNGDKGTTNLVHTKNVSKSDDRIQLEGTIDELSSHIGVLKTMIRRRRNPSFSGKNSGKPDENCCMEWLIPITEIIR